MASLCVIDGTYELFRAHFGQPPRRDPSGAPIGGVYGVLRSMIALLKNPKVTHLAVATDHVIESFRNDLYDGYKDGSEIDPDVRAQFESLDEGIRALGITLWSMTEFEADDAMASATRIYAKDFDKIVLATPDKDLAQCVSDPQIMQWDRRKNVYFKEADVVERFGVAPASIPDYLGLVGDKADGIPGVPRWGAKSTATVLSTYKHIEDIPLDRAWKIKVRGAASLTKSLAEHLDKAKLWKQLATLRYDVPLKQKAKDLLWRGPASNWAAFCELHGMERLVSTLPASKKA